MKVKKNSVLRKCITHVICIAFILAAINIINIDTVFSEPGDETDTRLAKLSVRCGELVPEFSPDVYEYKVYVTEDQEIKNCRANAEAMNYLSDISAEGATEFSDEDVERKVTVTGISGEKSEYTIKFHIIRDSELLLDGKLYIPVGEPDLTLLPTGFEKVQMDIKGEQTTVARNKDENFNMVQYVNDLDETDVLWYMYDSQSNEIYPSEVKEMNGEKYITVSSGKTLMYGNSDDNKGYYLYDENKGTIESLTEENQLMSASIFIVMVASIMTFLLCVIIFIVLRKGKKRRVHTEKKIQYFMPYLSLDEDESEAMKQRRDK